MFLLQLNTQSVVLLALSNAGRHICVQLQIGFVPSNMQPMLFVRVVLVAEELCAQMLVSLTV